MLLSDFLKHLAYGELSQLSIGVSNNGEIAEKDYPKVISFLNLGLTQLHTKLPLIWSEMLVRINPLNHEYILSSKYALSTNTSFALCDNFYILDRATPYKDTLLKIEEVNSESGHTYTINDRSDEDTVYVPKYNVLNFAQPKDEMVSVLYRANHELLPMSRTIDLSTEIDVPDVCIEPLMTYIVSKLLSGLSNVEGIQEAAAFSNKFELQIQAIEDAGLVPVDKPTNQRIWREGWV